jgi:hypothetical protein
LASSINLSISAREVCIIFPTKCEIAGIYSNDRRADHLSLPSLQVSIHAPPIRKSGSRSSVSWPPSSRFQSTPHQDGSSRLVKKFQSTLLLQGRAAGHRRDRRRISIHTHHIKNNSYAANSSGCLPLGFQSTLLMQEKAVRYRRNRRGVSIHAPLFTWGATVAHIKEVGDVPFQSTLLII